MMCEPTKCQRKICLFSHPNMHIWDSDDLNFAHCADASVGGETTESCIKDTKMQYLQFDTER